MSNNIISKKGNNAKIWKFIDGSDVNTTLKTEYYYSGSVNEGNRFDGHGEIKYYDKSILKYIGDFKDGNKHGTGMEYYREGDTYYGEFKNNVREGKGTLHSKEGSIKYGGNWVNDEPESEMTYYSYDENNNKKYYGGFKNGKYNGFGIMFGDKEQLKQIGEYKDGTLIRSLDFYITRELITVKRLKRQDDAEKYFKILSNKLNDDLCEPLDIQKIETFREYLMEEIYTGDVIYYSPNGSMLYNGQIKNNIFHGSGTYYDLSNKYILSGKFVDNCFKVGEISKQRDGNIDIVFNGTMIVNSVINSSLVNSLDHNIFYSPITLNIILRSLNQGKFYYNESNDDNSSVKYNYCFEGTFLNGHFERGIQSKLNVRDKWNIIYDGKFNTNAIIPTGTNYKKYHGHGIEYLNGSKKYEGSYINGKYQGIGTLYENNVVIYTGNFNDGKKHGSGILFDSTGELVYEGNFRNDNID